MKHFDPARALQFAASIARPRLCGTEEERAVAAQVKEAFAGAGLAVEEEWFEFRPVADGLLRLSLLLTHAALAALGVGLYVDRRLSYAGLGACALLAVLLPLLIRGVFNAAAADVAADAPRRPGRIRTSNVAGRATGPAEGPLLIFMAHYDSKSQSLSLGGRIGLFNRARTATFGYVGVALAGLAGAEIPPWLLGFAGAAVLALSAPLYALRTHNRSPGAMDNASGVGALVELARQWRTLPAASRCRALFLAPSAEEFGMVGSDVWVRRHAGELKGEKRLRVLNLDSIGYAGRVWVVPPRGPRVGKRTMTQEVVEAGAAVGVKVHPYPLAVGLMTDHASFTRRRFPCATLLTHTWAASRLHTERDVAESLKEEGFEQVGRVALRFIEETAAAE